MARKKRWTIEAGSQIYFDGEPFVGVTREGETRPVEADGSVHIIVDYFNRKGVTPDSIYEKHMGHPRSSKSRNPKLKNRLLR